MTRSIYLPICVTGILLFALILISFGRAAAQGPTPTSVQLSVPTKTPLIVQQITLTPSWTPTDQGAASSQIVAEAKDATTGANLRSSPSTDASIVGKIKAGQFYPVQKRFEKWFQIQCGKACPQSADKTAWVFGDIVNITGGAISAIPALDLTTIPSPNSATGAAQATANYLTRTPGAPGTATALQGSATGVFAATPTGPAVTGSGPQPTFTFPPPIVEATLPSHVTTISQEGLPPVVPIVGLAILGFAGMVISSLRRLGR